MKEYIRLFFKGLGMGAANVIPGVSGGTIALITGIFEKLINSIKSFDLAAIKYFFTGRFSKFSKHVNLDFLFVVFLGIGVSIFSLALLLKELFCSYPVFVWSYFFGLILGSIYFVGKTIDKWSLAVIITFIIGTCVAVFISVLKPASENDSLHYLVICGVVAVCSMIIPGLSGSFVLILLGNYRLVMINAVSELNMTILLPVVLGAVIGLVAFSHFLSWIYKKFRNETTSMLTGFIMGSLGVIWPWKIVINAATGEKLDVNQFGAIIADNQIICDLKVYYGRHILPEEFNFIILISILLLAVGIVSIWILEKSALNINKSTS
jgi:putative membrane protein